MWQSGNSLGEDERESIARIVRTSGCVKVFLSFAFVALGFVLTAEDIWNERYADINPIYVIANVFLLFSGIREAKQVWDRLAILREGTFEWTEDTIVAMTHGSRYQRRLPIGAVGTYQIQQLPFSIRPGDSVIGVRFHPDKTDKRYRYYSISEPIAYKI